MGYTSSSIDTADYQKWCEYKSRLAEFTEIEQLQQTYGLLLKERGGIATKPDLELEQFIANVRFKLIKLHNL